jgi:hypothetical protein
MSPGPVTMTEADPGVLAGRVERLLAEAPSPGLDRGIPFRAAQFEAGLAWVSFPVGHGGLGLPPGHQVVVDRLLRDAGVEPANLRNPIRYGNVAPVLAAYGTDQQRRRYLRARFTTEDIWRVGHLRLGQIRPGRTRHSHLGRDRRNYAQHPGRAGPRPAAGKVFDPEPGADQ